MVHDSNWRELTMVHGLSKARAVATTIAAMEFEARIRHAIRDVEIEHDTVDDGGPYLVDVHPAAHDALHEVLDEIMEEQQDFDASLDGRATTHRTRNAFLIALILIVAVLALLRLVEL